MTPPTETVQANPETVTSRDGTRIGLRRYGQGPSVVILHGSMSSSLNHTQLAQALADAFTVYLPDRRGRGMSDPYTGVYTADSEARDLEAVLDHTGSANVFGVSVGAMIALKTAATTTAIEKLAVYEPPLFPNSEAALAIRRRIDEQLAEGRVAGALAAAMQGAHLGPEFINKLPHGLLERMTRLMLRRERKKGAGDYLPFGELAPTLHYETEIIAQMSGSVPSLAELSCEVLLLGGARSAPFLKRALDRLEQVVPTTRRVELRGLDHSGSWNTDLGGKPTEVARELRRFFAAIDC
jgi:pimeloyl-ACP methyl ester carboxylesterase